MSLKFRCAMLITVIAGVSIQAWAIRSTSLSVKPAAGTYGQNTSLQATLTSGFRFLPNETISFALNGINVGSATTNSVGVATLNNASLAGIQARIYPGGVTAVFAGSGPFRSSEGTASLTVNPAAASVQPNTASKTYGAPDPSLTATLSGFLAGDNVTVTTFTRTPGETVGGSPYTIQATLGPAAVLSNYSITYKTAAFVINPAAASVQPNAASKTYGAADPSLTGALSGFLAGDNVTATFIRTSGETVGGSPYTIQAALGPASVLSNYSITYKTAAFVINPAPLNVTANTSTKLQGQPNPAFTAAFAGFVNGDTASSLTGTLSFNTAATTSSPVGAYSVIPGGLTSTNYSITFVGGTLNVVNAYVTNKNIYTPPDYLTFLPPAVGSSYIDTPGFYTPIKRLSDSMHTVDAGTGNPSVVLISPEYSTISPFNQDNTRLLLEHLSYFALYDGAGSFIRNLPFEISASSEPRWSRSDPNVFYYVRVNQLKKYNVATLAMSVVHTFSEYSAISARGQADISFDGDHFVFVGDKHYVFLYEISTDSKGGVFDTGVIAFDNVEVTPDNNVAIGWNTVGKNRSQGIELFDRNMNFLRQVAPSDSHSDFTRDVNGDEVLIWINSNDPMPICTHGVVKIRLADATQTCLATFDWSVALHISGTDNSGWVFVETYAPSDPIPPTGWFAYTDEFVQIKLDGTQVRRFAHHRSRPLNSYTYQPKITVSRDGSKVVYASNFGLQQILGLPKEYSDAYMIDLSVISPDTLGTPDSSQ